MSPEDALEEVRRIVLRILQNREGDGCICHGCGLKYKADLMVPDDIWDRIRPEWAEPGTGLLCARCIMERIVSEGIWTAGRAVDIDAAEVNAGRGDKIIPAEIYAWFRERVPLVAMKIMFPESSHPLTMAETRQILAALAAADASPADAEKGRYCICNSKTNPCIVCGKPKFMDNEWLKRKIKEEPDGMEVGAGFEIFSAPDSAAALDAETEVKIKPLEWVGAGHGIAYAASIVGTYWVNREGYWWRGDGPIEGRGGEAAAQADYEHLIRSALVTPEARS